MEEKKYSLLSWLHSVAHASAQPCRSALRPASPPARADAPWAWAKPDSPPRHLRRVGKIPQPLATKCSSATAWGGGGRPSPSPHPPASPRPFHQNPFIKGQSVAGTSAAAGSLAGGAGAEMMGAGAERGCRWVQEPSAGCRRLHLSPCKFTRAQAWPAPSTSGHRLQTPGRGGSFHAAQQMSSEA